MIRNQRGISLIAILITVSAGSIVALSMGQLVVLLAQGQRGLQLSSDIFETHKKIKEVLSNRTACRNTLAGFSIDGTRHMLNNDASDDIKDAGNTVVYRVGSNEVAILQGIRVQEWQLPTAELIENNDASTPGLDVMATLRIDYAKTGSILGSGIDKENMTIAAELTGMNPNDPIKNCHATRIGGLSSGTFWDANGLNIFNTNPGSVGIGTNTPSELFHVNGTARVDKLGIGNPAPADPVSLEVTGDSILNGSNTIGSNLAGTNNIFTATLNTFNGAIRMNDPPTVGPTLTILDDTLITGGGNLTVDSGWIRADAYFFNSDERYKKNFNYLDGVSLLQKLNGLSYNWRDTDQKDYGFIAQEVEKVLPELVHTDEAGFKAVKYGSLIAPLVEAVKAQQKQIEELKKQIKELSTHLKD